MPFVVVTKVEKDPESNAEFVTAQMQAGSVPTWGSIMSIQYMCSPGTFKINDRIEFERKERS